MAAISQTHNNNNNNRNRVSLLQHFQFLPFFKNKILVRHTPTACGGDFFIFTALPALPLFGPPPPCCHLSSGSSTTRSHCGVYFTSIKLKNLEEVRRPAKSQPLDNLLTGRAICGADLQLRVTNRSDQSARNDEMHSDSLERNKANKFHHSGPTQSVRNRHWTVAPSVERVGNCVLGTGTEMMMCRTRLAFYHPQKEGKTRRKRKGGKGTGSHTK